MQAIERSVIGFVRSNLESGFGLDLRLFGRWTTDYIERLCDITTAPGQHPKGQGAGASVGPFSGPVGSPIRSVKSLKILEIRGWLFIIF